MVVSGVVVAECRDRRRTWAVFAGDIIADIYAEVVVPARTTVRRFLERELATLFSKPGTPDRELLTLNLTNESYDRLLALDHSLVGTDDYMGLAYFWHHEYRHTLRDCTHVSRARVHDELRAAGLPLDGCSANHGKIIRRFAEMDE